MVMDSWAPAFPGAAAPAPAQPGVLLAVLVLQPVSLALAFDPLAF